MARPAYSDDQVLEIQRDIRATALAVFKREGLRGLTLRAIARELGWTPAALYRYYANKDDLIAALCAEGFREMGAALRAARSESADSRDGARAALRAYLAFAMEEPERFRLMYALDPGDRPSLPDVHRERDRAFDEARAIAADAIAEGWLEGDPNLAAHLLWVGCHGLAALSLAEQLDLGCRYEDLLDPLLDLLVSRGPSPSKES